MRVIVQSGTAVGARHKDHSVTGNVAGNISQSLSQYFFGSDQKGLLTIEKFEDFHDQLMEAILRLEVRAYSICPYSIDLLFLAYVCNVRISQYPHPRLFRFTPSNYVRT